MKIICGIDEAGRGPLAGPVCAAAVILPSNFPTTILNDSKRLSSKKRLELREIIIAQATAYGIGWASAVEIDRLNILQATLLAMQRAFAVLEQQEVTIDLILVDGNIVPQLPLPCQSVVAGDSKIAAIMAASILAKTSRDAFMIKMDALFPQYGYAAHKGYPTVQHKAACRRWGPSPIQRHSFSF